MAGRPARARTRRRVRAGGRRRGRTGRRRRASRRARAGRRAGSGSASVSFASRSAVAASELPPPRPAATGIRFAIVARQRGSTPAAAASAVRASRTSVSAGEAGDRAGSCAGSIETRSPRSTRCSTVATSCLPSSRAGPTTSARLIFAGAGARFTAPRSGASASATNSARLERLGPGLREPPDRLERGGRLLARRRGRRARASSAASCAGARTRPRRSALIRSKRSGSGTRRNATSAESTFGGGRKTVRATGWKPVRRAASWTSTETAPYAFVDGSAKKRSATSRCTITHQSSMPGSPVRLSATIGVATLYGRFATSFVGAGSERGEVERERVAPVEVDVRALFQLPEVRRERAVELDGVDVAHTARRGSGSGRRGRGRSRARRRRRRARRAGRSRRGCSRPRGSAGRAASSGSRSRSAEKAAVAFASIRAASSSASSPRAAASAATVWTTWAGSFGLPAQRLRREVRAVGLGQDPVGGNLRGGLAQLRRLRVGDVAGEGEVPAALERRRRAGPARRSSA